MAHHITKNPKNKNKNIKNTFIILFFFLALSWSLDHLFIASTWHGSLTYFSLWGILSWSRGGSRSCEGAGLGFLIPIKAFLLFVIFGGFFFFFFFFFVESVFGMWRDPGAPTDSFYEVRPECTDVPKTRFKIKVPSLLNALRVYWYRLIDGTIT